MAFKMKNAFCCLSHSGRSAPGRSVPGFSRHLHFFYSAQVAVMDVVFGPSH